MARRSSPRVLAGCFSCQARQRTEWCVLNEDDLKRINDAKKSRQCLPGEVLYHQGDACRGIVCIESGMIGIRKIDADGNSVLLGLAYPGDTLGYRALLMAQGHEVSAEVLKKGSVCLIGEGTVRSLLDHNPSLGHRFLWRAVKDLGEAENKFLESVTLTVRARFAHLLLILKDRYATDVEDGAISLELPLSRQDLAAMIGIRPETMSRTIRQFEDDGIAHFSGRTVHVPRIASLLDEFEHEDYL
ncbi:MAG TPA: Crp/Fnr family transcriptional regulator [Rhodospirillales bacterium]|jgi:CRP-like cAMP-binding protein|nr:Crp/Fnr family transcriptional regulator [Rhodospirillales bacterium]